MASVQNMIVVVQYTAEMAQPKEELSPRTSRFSAKLQTGRISYASGSTCLRCPVCPVCPSILIVLYSVLSLSRLMLWLQYRRNGYFMYPWDADCAHGRYVSGMSRDKAVTVEQTAEITSPWEQLAPVESEE